MLDEVNHELFALCEEAVIEIVTPFLKEMRISFEETPETEKGAKEKEIIEKTIAGLSKAQRFAIACYIMDFRADVVNCSTPMLSHDEVGDWYHLQWPCDEEG